MATPDFVTCSDPKSPTRLSVTVIDGITSEQYCYSVSPGNTLYILRTFHCAQEVLEEKHVTFYYQGSSCQDSDTIASKGIVEGSVILCCCSKYPTDHERFWGKRKRKQERQAKELSESKASKKRRRTSRRNDASNAIYKKDAIDHPFASGSFRLVAKGEYTVGERAGERSVCKWFKKGK